MAHIDEVKRVLGENGFDLNKFEFTFEKANYSLLSIGSDQYMKDFRSRVSKCKRVVMFIQDESPVFYPAIKGTFFDMVRVTLIK